MKKNKIINRTLWANEIKFKQWFAHLIFHDILKLTNEISLFNILREKIF